MKILSVVALAGMFLSVGAVSLKAEGLTLTAEPTVIKSFGPLDILNPLTSPRVAYYYDTKRSESLVGGEIPFARFYIIEATAGLGATIPKEGESARESGFVGGNISLPNPLPAFASLNELRPGLAGGYSLTYKDFFLALKASIPIGN